MKTLGAVLRMGDVSGKVYSRYGSSPNMWHGEAQYSDGCHRSTLSDHKAKAKTLRELIELMEQMNSPYPPRVFAPLGTQCETHGT